MQDHSLARNPLFWVVILGAVVLPSLILDLVPRIIVTLLVVVAAVVLIRRDRLQRDRA